MGFTVAEHPGSGSYYLTGVSELLATLDEHAVATQTLLLSPYRGPLEDRLRKWSAVLARTGDALEEWMAVQRSWLRLWPLFQAPDLALTLPAEARTFISVNKHWKRTLTAVKRGACRVGCAPVLSVGVFLLLLRHVLLFVSLQVVITGASRVWACVVFPCWALQVTKQSCRARG